MQDPSRLPNLRPKGDHADPYELPRHRNGTTPQMHGRFPDYNVLDEKRHWDDETRKVVIDRVENVPKIRFFTHEEAETLKAYCDTVTAQDEEPRIPVLSYVDEKLFTGKRDGYRYHDMPDDGTVWKLVAAGLDHSAKLEWAARSFAAAPPSTREDVVSVFSDGKLRGGPWQQLNVKRAFKLTTRDICQAFYAHPWSWNEIGFGGPAYPRGYAAFGSGDLGDREQWEPVQATPR